jgi:hypothetical protein
VVHGACVRIPLPQDSIKLGQFTLNLGLRYDNYDGLSQGYGVQPRTGIVYQVRATGTGLHFSYGATRIHIVPPGTYNPDTNPSRITPRNLIDFAVGADSLWKKDTYTLSGKMSVVNTMNQVALFNFLSSFSGTHFISPRVLQGELTFHF